MDSRKIVCLFAAGFIGVTLTVSTSGALALPPSDVVVVGKQIDPELQRTVSYEDLDLSVRADKKILKKRIFTVAGELCWALNGDFGLDTCQSDAVHSTDGQVASAILRAEQKMAGLPVGPAMAISMVIGSR